MTTEIAAGLEPATSHVREYSTIELRLKFLAEEVSVVFTPDMKYLIFKVRV